MAGELDYASNGPKCALRWLGTVVFSVLGVVAIIVWLVTFDPHGGSNWAFVLFLPAIWVLELIFPYQSIPPMAWFGGMLGQWVVMGLMVDGGRMVVRRMRRRG